MKKLLTIISSFFILACVISSSVIASGQALNNAYLIPEYWNDKSNIEIITFNFNKGKISGATHYAIDKLNNSIYFKVDFASNANLNDLKLHFDFYNDYNEYHFAVNKYGMCDYDGNESNAFEIIYDFGSSNIVGIKVLDGSLINKIRFTINYQGRNYIMIRNLLLDATPVIEESTNANTTTLEQASNTIQNSSTTFENATEIESSTKFVPSSHIETEPITHPSTNSTITKYSNDGIEQAATTVVSENKTNLTTSNSSAETITKFDKRKFAVIAGIVLLSISLLLLIIYFIRKRKPLDEN